MMASRSAPFEGLPIPPAEGPEEGVPYWRALREHRLVLQECRSCGVVRTPPSVICYRCHSFESAWREIPARGTIFSWTRVWHPANEAVADYVPYVIVWVVVDEASGSRVLGNLVGDPLREITIGAPVLGEFQDRETGTVLNWALADASGSMTE